MGATQQSMLSHLEANGVLHLTLAQIGDLMDIDGRIKNGDESGWRGDPSMGIFINKLSGQFEVWGIDRAGCEYKACSSDTLDVNIIHKLRDGDPVRGDPFQKVLDHNAKIKADRDSLEQDKIREVADKMEWAIRQDFGQHLGGRKRMHAIPELPVKEN